MKSFASRITRLSRLVLGTGASSLLLLATAPESSAEIIASESFLTVTSDDTGATYNDGDSMGFASNRSTVGPTNFGFSVGNLWVNSNSGAQPFTAIDLTHSATPGTTQVGGVQLDPVNAVQRNSNRLLAATPTTVASFYLSGSVFYEIRLPSLVVTAWPWDSRTPSP